MTSFRGHAVMTFLRLQKQVALLHPDNTQLMRRSFRGLTSLSPLPAGIVTSRRDIDGVPVMVLKNQRLDRQPGKTLVYLHGGGYVIGSPLTHRAFAGSLGQIAQADEIWLPDYRLAPEHPFPAGLDDVLTVWRHLLHDHPEKRLVLAGESAGGGLSAALCIAAREAGLRLPEKAYLQSPWLDLSLSGLSHIRQDGRDPFLGKWFLERDFVRRYAGDTPRQHPLLSPLFAELHGLPPLLIQVGSREVLLDDSRHFARKATAAGVSVTLEVGRGLWHGWPLFAPFVPEATQARQQAGHWLRERPGV